jgi:hypothetical protein
MPLQSSGAISLANVQTEFGGSNPIGINEYYGVAAGVPGSGTISLADFYGKSAVALFNFTEGVFGVSINFYGNSQTHNFNGNIVTPGSASSPKTFTVYQYAANPSTVTLRYYQGGALNTTWTGYTFSLITFSFGSSSMQFTSTIYDYSDYEDLGLGEAYVSWNTAQGAPTTRTLYRHISGYGIRDKVYYTD